MRIEEQTGGGSPALVADGSYPASWDEVALPLAARRRIARQKQGWARSKAWELRDRLRVAMGAKCVKCGATEELEFHHPHGRNWVARKKNQLARMKLYWRDFMLGLLELLCSGCNKSAGAPCGFWQRTKAKKRRRGRR